LRNILINCLEASVSGHPGGEPLIRLVNEPQSLRFRRAEKAGVSSACASARWASSFFDASSSREPVPTSLENAIEYQRQAFQADRPDDDGKKRSEPWEE
jgi:hypothetical protein